MHVTKTLNASKPGARYEINLWKSNLNITDCNKIACQLFDIYLQSIEPMRWSLCTNLEIPIVIFKPVFMESTMLESSNLIGL